jgi:putative nucleotidyltransferase with HDIG domain
MTEQPLVPGPPASVIDPVTILKGLTGLRQLTSLYPQGHPIVDQALQQLDETLREVFKEEPEVRIDVIRGDAHLNGVPFRLESRQHPSVLHEFRALGLDSIHLSRGVTRDELRSVSALVAAWKDRGPSEPVGPALERAGVTHVSLGRLVELDTRLTSQQWPDAPTGPLDPDYAESLQRAEETFEAFAAGGQPTARAVRDLLHLLMFKVTGNSAALGQILAVKQYENHTYCHSVNVSILGLLLGRQIGLDEAAQATLVEGALLHDVGKTRVPIEILRKPAALDQRERRIIERHTVQGAMMLVDVPGLDPLTPMIALEHHRHAVGGGYPDLGNARPHALSRIVSVADVYEALTGARAYRPPALPEQACLILARAAGTQLDAALVKAFVGAVTFFPAGTLVRTSRDEVGVVVRASVTDPLHPLIALVEDLDPSRPLPIELNLAERGADGAYLRHVAQSLHPPRTVPAVAAATRQEERFIEST